MNIINSRIQSLNEKSVWSMTKQSSNFDDALFTLYLPGGYLVYYAIKTLFLYEQMPSFEFKIKKVERRNGAVAGADEAPVHEEDAVNDNVEA